MRELGWTHSRSSTLHKRLETPGRDYFTWVGRRYNWAGRRKSKWPIAEVSHLNDQSADTSFDEWWRAVTLSVFRLNSLKTIHLFEAWKISEDPQSNKNKGLLPWRICCSPRFTSNWVITWHNWCVKTNVVRICKNFVCFWALIYPDKHKIT